MRTAWGLLAVCVLAGCSGKKDRERAPIVREEEIPPAEMPKVAPVEVDPAASVDPPTSIVEASGAAAVGGHLASPVDPKPTCVEDSTVVSFEPAKLRACFDHNDDGEADRCVTWGRDGKVQTIAPVFAVEDTDRKPAPQPPVAYRSDTDNNDDDRISLDGNTAEICPLDRACMKIMPKVEDGEVLTVVTDPDYKRALFLERSADEGKGALEIWDLATGRLRARAAIKRLVEGETYDFTLHLGTGAVFVLAEDSEGGAFGTVFGLDGSYRGELAQGSRTLGTANIFRHAGVLGVLDAGPDDSDKPYVLHLHSLASGGALGKLSIKRDGDNAPSIQILPNGFVAVTQFGEQMRVDMIDLRTRTDRVLLAPGC